jgi:hypothetical protein
VQGGLRGAVGDLPVGVGVARDRPDEDHDAAPGLRDGAAADLQGEVRVPQDQVELPVPAHVVQLGQGPERRHADDVHHAPDRSRLPGRVGEKPFHRIAPGDVRGQRDASDLRRDGGRRGAVGVHDHHRRSGLGQRVRALPPDPGPAAQDDEHPLLEGEQLPVVRDVLGVLG